MNSGERVKLQLFQTFIKNTYSNSNSKHDVQHLYQYLNKKNTSKKFPQSVDIYQIAQEYLFIYFTTRPFVLLLFYAYGAYTYIVNFYQWDHLRHEIVILNIFLVKTLCITIYLSWLD
jgi:hypothetical protein